MTFRVVDLYCGVGGASKGWARAGFEVVGVDIEAQPDYPFEFVKGDALEFDVSGFDFIMACPPCQNHIAITAGNRGRVGWTDGHVNLVSPTRVKLVEAGVPWVMECGVGRHLRRDLMLCGEMFGLGVLRHRWFEFSDMVVPPATAHVKHRGKVRGWRHGVYQDGPYVAVYGQGGGKASVEEARVAMGIDWTWSQHGLVEAIPPAYTEFVGKYIMSALEAGQ